MNNIAEKSKDTSKDAQKEAQKASQAAQKLRDRRDELKQDIENTNSTFEKLGPKLSESRVKELQGKLNTAKKELKELEKPLAAAEQKEDAARKKAIALGNKTLEAQRAANAEAEKAGLPKPYEKAAQVTDIFDAGSLSKNDQVKLLGGQSPVTPEEAGRADVNRIALALKNSPGAGAKELEAQLAGNTDPKYRTALINGAKEQLQQLGESLYGHTEGEPAEPVKDTVKTLARITEGLSAEDRRALLDGVAAGVKPQEFVNEKVHLPEAIKEAMREGNGAFGSEFAAALHRKGLSGRTNSVAEGTLDSMKQARENFEDKAKKVEDLNGQLGELMQRFGPSMTSKEREAAVDAFKKKHSKEYDALEGAAKELEGTLDSAKSVLESEALPGDAGKDLREEAKKVIEQLPAFAETDHGQEVLRDEVAKQADKKPNFLDNLEKVTSTIKDGNDILTKTAGAVTKATALRAIQLKSRGDTEGAKRLFDNLEKNHALYGVSQENMQKLVPHFKTLLSEKPKSEKWKEAQKALGNQFGELANDVPGSPKSTPGMNALRGLAVVAAGVGAAKNWQDIAKGEGGFDTYLKAFGDSVNAGGDAGLLAAEVFGKAGSAGTLVKLLGGASGVGAFVSAVGDGVASFKAFQDGKAFEGFSKGASAIGGTILATSLISAGLGAQVIPVGGQIVGGILVAAGAAGSLISKWKEGQDIKENAEVFLKAGGFSEQAADKLKGTDGNVGAFLDQVSKQSGIPVEQLRAKLNTLSDTELNRIVHAAEETKQSKEGQYIDKDATPGKVDVISSGRYTRTEIRSIADAIEYLRIHDVRLVA